MDSISRNNANLFSLQAGGGRKIAWAERGGYSLKGRHRPLETTSKTHSSWFFPCHSNRKSKSLPPTGRDGTDLDLPKAWRTGLEKWRSEEHQERFTVDWSEDCEDDLLNFLEVVEADFLWQVLLRLIGRPKKQEQAS